MTRLTASADPPSTSFEAPPSTAALLIATLRPEQWTKNLFLFAGLLFGGHLLDAPSIWRAICGFTVFIMKSTACG